MAESNLDVGAEEEVGSSSDYGDSDTGEQQQVHLEEVVNGLRNDHDYLQHQQQDHNPQDIDGPSNENVAEVVEEFQVAAMNMAEEAEVAGVGYFPQMNHLLHHLPPHPHQHQAQQHHQNQHHLHQHQHHLQQHHINHHHVHVAQHVAAPAGGVVNFNLHNDNQHHHIIHNLHHHHHHAHHHQEHFHPPHPGPAHHFHNLDFFPLNQQHQHGYGLAAYLQQQPPQLNVNALNQNQPNPLGGGNLDPAAEVDHAGGHGPVGVGNRVACNLKWLPDTLLNSALSSIAANFNDMSRSLKILPPELEFAVYRKLYVQGRLCQVGYDLCDLRLFATMLEVKHRRWELHQMFQSVMDHGLNLADTLVNAFVHSSARLLSLPSSSASPTNATTLNEIRCHLRLGFQLGTFLLEAGWYLEGERCFQNSIDLCKVLHQEFYCQEADLRALECSYRMLEAYNGYCRYPRAFTVMEQAQSLLNKVEMAFESASTTRHTEALNDLRLNLPDLYTQFSVLYFYVSKYTESMDYSMKALRLVDNHSPHKTTIDACRQAAKVLTVRRHFKEAELLIKHAASLAKYHFEGAKRFPDVLLDFGFYLTNVDMSEAAAKMYQMALNNRLTQFGGVNLKVAQAHEDLAYALYVQEYSYGNFTHAREHAEKALNILKELVPDNHLLLSSCRRVKALILEEIAIDSQDKNLETLLLQEAEDLHLSALTLCKRMFGEENIATAKHYGNLGRLYQSMRKLKEAEEMHKRAISIKKRLMGEDDYEVALSIGHLASLYNYDMGRYPDAELLYLKSMEIGKRLLGSAYSGLEYDYRGLMHCYVEMKKPEKVSDYANRLHQWKVLRDNELAKQAPESVWQSLPEPRDNDEVIQEFFKKFN